MSEEEQLISNADKLMLKEKYIDAIREYLKVLELVRGKNDELEADTCSKLSQAYSALDPKNDENSIKYGTDALAIHRRIGDNALTIMDLLNLGYIEQSAGKHESCKTYLQEAMESAKEFGDSVLLSMTMSANAECLARSKKSRNAAMSLYSEAMALSEKDHDWENYFEALYGLIGCIKEDGNEKAFKMAMEALDRIDQIIGTIKNKKERKEFKASVSFMYDLASDMAMEMENVEEAINIAQRLKSE